MQPCEVSKKIFIFSYRWKSAPEAMTACWMCFVMLFGGKTRLCVCSSCCGISPRGDEIDNEALELTKQMFDHQGDTRLNEESNRLCKQNTDFQSHSVCSETRDQYACVMGDILQRRKLGTTWEPDLEDSCVKLPCISKLWRPPPHDLRVEWSSILSPDRKWSSPTPENERVGFVAWQWLQHFHCEGLSTNVRPHWGLLASLLPRRTVIRDTRSEMTSLVRRLSLLREGGKTSTSSNCTCLPRSVFRLASLTST